MKEKETRRGRKRRSGEENTRFGNLPYVGIAAAAVILTVGAGLGIYFAQSGAYQETFMPNTTINGIDVAGKSVGEVKAMVEAELAGYELKIVERTGAEEVITREEIGLHTEFAGGLEQILEIQEPTMWIKSLWTEVEYRMKTMLVYDEALLAERVMALSCMDESRMEEPQDAYLSGYQFDTNCYEIIPETQGTELVKDAVLEAVSHAVMNLQEEVDLNAAGCYTKPAIDAENVQLTALADALNHYAGAVVTHRFGELEEVLDGDTIHQWLTIYGQTVTLDESKPAEYVKNLAKKYNTAYEKRPFLTTYGDVVTIPNGSYGWRMDQAKETEAVLAAVKDGVILTREPEWLQEGASHGAYDYGDTYVEVNLTGQHLFFYKHGELLVECDFVSGNASRKWGTPAGIHPITYKERNATLRGENYATPVSYWMPFNGNIGLHDADWRGSFGGAIYKTNGSHGCVNLPPAAAKIIYENIAKGDPVICYHLDGTETKKTTKAGEINTSGVASVNQPEGNETVAKPAEKPTETKPQQTTRPAQTKPAPQPTQPAAPETTPAAPETSPAVPETTPAAPEISPVAPETAPAVPETSPVETVPTVPENQPAPPTNPTLAPEAGTGGLTETRPAEIGPGAAGGTPNQSMTPETGSPIPPTTFPAVTETRPAGDGPASGIYGPAGPGYQPDGSHGPGGITMIIDPSGKGPGSQ